MPKYDKKTQKKVGKVMREFKEGDLTMGKSGKKVKNHKQAIAIALSEAREEGGKVPPAPQKNKKSRASVLKKTNRSKTTSPLKQRKGKPERGGSKQVPTKPGKGTRHK